MSLWGRFVNSAAAFRMAWLNADPQRMQPGLAPAEWDAWNLWESRQPRYDLLWSMWQNNSFWEQVHPWAVALRYKLSLYKHTRQILNPGHRLGEFWATHIAGGPLDQEAGDGESTKSALPILTTNEALRPAIAKLWADSQWAIHKDNWGRYGAVLGDVGLMLCDDRDTGTVRMEVVHPGHLKWLDRDRSGIVTGYEREETRYDPRRVSIATLSPTIDPRALQTQATYNEKCWIDKGKVRYQTFLNGGFFDWTLAPDGRPYGTRQGAVYDWTVPYSVVPLVVTPHINIGLSFGMSELHAMIGKAFENDDVASNANDQIRRILNAPYILFGAKKPKDEPTPNPETRTRTESRFFYCDEPTGRAEALVADMPLDAVGKQNDRISAEIEKDFPELRFYLMNEIGDTSGRALRVARQAAETKVQTRRTSYDVSLVLAQKIALLIGCVRGYDGYAGLGVTDLGDSTLDHSIAHRPVFSPDPLDDIEEANSFWTMVGTATAAGVPLEMVLEDEGWPADKIARMKKLKQDNANVAMDRVQQRMALAGANAPERNEDGYPG